MEAERWREVDRLFAAALDWPPEERAASLEKACQGDPELRAEVERLLNVDERLGGFLEQPAVPPWGVAGESDENGPLGPYRLLRRLGSGGSGTVYLARRDDEQYNRLVAIKILRSGLEGTEIYHRFLAERQILARLEHPNIARLYDGGSTPDGRPYLVMELVEGLPVDVYCDRHRLSIDRRLELFRRICGAIQYAHQNLLVHRDIKPLNILVTADGEPKLLDFGIAKQLAAEGEESGAQTRTGLRLMTPSFASPEQVRGEAVTTASDVYSLGVLLYELLVGRSPYRLTTGLPHEIETAICEQEPERPSQALARAPGVEPEVPAGEVAAARDTRVPALVRRLAGDLDNIVLKALRKEAPRRYASAAALSQDVENHLLNLPVAARPDTLAYRTRTFVRRHRAAVLAAAAVLALVVGFLVSLVLQGRQLARERDKANYALSFLVDTFQQADPFHTRGERLTARDILDRGAGRVSRELAGQPDVQAALMDAIGRVDLGLGRIDRAAPLLEGALAVRQRTQGGSLEMAQSLDHVAAVRLQRSDFKGSEQLLRQSLALKRRLPGDNAVEVARTLNQLGDTVARRGGGDPKAAEPLHRQALAVARRAEGREGPTVSASLIALASRVNEQGDYPSAEKLLQQGLAMETRLLGEENADVIRHQQDLAELLVNQGKFREAEAVIRHALDVERRILGEGHPDLGELYGDLAGTLLGQKRYPEAETLYQKALPAIRSAFGDADFRVADALGDLGATFMGEGRYGEAVAVHQQALEIRRRVYGDHSPKLAQSYLHLAEARRRLGQAGVALPLARQSLAILQETLGPEHPYTAYSHQAIGLALRDQGKPAESEPHLRRALTLLAKSVPPGHPQLALGKVELAACLVDLGRLDEAEALLREALPQLQAVFGPGAPPVKRAQGILDTARAKRGEAR
jgi:serine/threonine-protein kinase